MRKLFITNGPNQFYREGEDLSFLYMRDSFIDFIYDDASDAFFNELKDSDDWTQFTGVLNRRGYKVECWNDLGE